MMKPGFRGTSLRRCIILAAVVLAAAAPVHGMAQQAVKLQLKPAAAVFDVSDQEFTQITSVRELSDGRVLVADRKENRLVVIDRAMQRATPIGRIGEGPEEYKGIGWLFVLSGDSTLLTDWQARRWFVMHGSEIVRTIPARETLNVKLGPILAGIDRQDRVLGTAAFHYPPGPRLGAEFADSLFVLLANRRGSRIDTIARIAGRGRFGVNSSAGTMGASPLATADAVVLFPDGWIAVAWTEPYRVDWRAPAGVWTRGRALPFTAETVGEAEKCAALRRWTAEDGSARCRPEEFTHWPRQMPPFFANSTTLLNAYASSGVLAMPDGRLMIRRAVSLKRAGTHYDITDRKGELSATMSLGPNEAVIGFGPRSIYIAVTDDLGLQRLRRHPWP